MVRGTHNRAYLQFQCALEETTQNNLLCQITLHYYFAPRLQSLTPNKCITQPTTSQPFMLITTQPFFVLSSSKCRESHKDKVTRYFRWFIVFTGISRLVRMMSPTILCKSCFLSLSLSTLSKGISWKSSLKKRWIFGS